MYCRDGVPPMRSWSRCIALPLLAFPAGLLFGVFSGPNLSAGPSALGHAQMGGGLGAVLPSEPASPPTVAGAGLYVPPSGSAGPASTSDPARYALAQQRGQQASPLVDGLQSNPDVLLNLMRSVRDDPTLRQQALERMRSSGGLVGVGANAVSDRALQGTLDTLLADPQRLQGILGMLSSNPQLLGGMLGSMGLQGVTPDEVNQVLGQLQSDPTALQGLARGDQATVDRLVPMTGVGAAGGGSPGRLPSVSSDSGPVDLSGLMQMASAAQLAQQGGGQGAAMLGGLGAAGGQIDPGLASQLLGTGASLSMLADMLGIFGGAGPQMTELQSSLRAGDVQALLGMVQQIYGQNGSLSQELGVDVNSYTDLLNTLLTDE